MIRVQIPELKLAVYVVESGMQRPFPPTVRSSNCHSSCHSAVTACGFGLAGWQSCYAVVWHNRAYCNPIVLRNTVSVSVRCLNTTHSP